MKIAENHINVDNIEKIFDKYLGAHPVFSEIKRCIYDIFNIWNNDKIKELRKLQDRIEYLNDFLIDLIYGEHELN